MALSNAKYDTIMRLYNRRQTAAKQAQEARVAEIYEKIPAIEKLNRQIPLLAVEQIQKKMEGDQNAVLTFRQKTASIAEERKALLTAYGYPADYLDMTYTCPDCQDTGFIGDKKCHCFLQAEIDLFYSQSHLKEVLERENFDTFSYDYYAEESLPSIRRAVMEARLFIESFDTDFQNLFLCGSVGIGKTFLSNCIAKELLDSGHSVLYFTAFELFDALAKASFGKEKEEEQGENELASLIFDCDLLILDDLGTELVNSFTSSQLFLCINERILKQKSTIISSNLNLATLLEVYTERTFSRISSNYKMVEMIGSDIRIKKKFLENT